MKIHIWKSKEKTKIIFGFRSNTQGPLFMIMKIYYHNDEVVWGEVLFEIE